MPGRLRESLLQGNRVLPVVLAILAVLILAWVVFGLVPGGQDQGQVSDQEIVPQSQGNGTDPAAPQVENRNVDSYAAYTAKDPFRPLIESAGANATAPAAGGGASGGTTSEPAQGQNGGNEANTFGETIVEGGGTAEGRTSGGGEQRGQGVDSDGDKVSDGREAQLGLDPTNPDTDGDGIRDGADDSNGDGRPDRDIGRRGGGSDGRNGSNGGLFDSGGSLLPSGK